MARGLRPHTHEDRRRVLEKVASQARAQFGDNLVALAATGSFARGDDGPYSDLEATAFLTEMPSGKRGVGRIVDGLLVELIWTTRQAWLDMVCASPGEEWHLAGSDILQPVINPEFIASLKAEGRRVRRDTCLGLAERHWHEVQESTAKVLKAAGAGDAEALSLVYPDMARHVLISLAFINARPFTTFARFIAEARGFDLLPPSFEPMVAALRGDYAETAAIHALALAIFDDMEGLLDLTEVRPYADALKLFE